MRYGFASGSYYNGKNWTPHITDNDGLWTAMYASGELMRYSTLKKTNAS